MFHPNTESSLKGFTLLELLIVIGILAILAVAVVMVINPAQLLAQARDSRRLSDLNTLQTALNFYSVESGQDFSSPDHLVYTSLPDTSSDCSSYSLPSLPSGWSYHCVTEDHLRDIDGSGWLPVDFSSLSPSPLSTLPVDPKNDADYYYTFVKGGSYEITSRVESDKYASKAANDGGVDPAMYETGTDLHLSPFIHGLVAYWNFDETGTTANDLSGFSNDGLMYSSSTVTDLHTSSGCVLGKCASFDGDDDYVDCGDGASLNITTNAITIAAWVNIQDSSAVTTVYGTHYNKNDYTAPYNLYIFDAVPRFTMGNGTAWFNATSSQTLNVNTWYYLVGTIDDMNNMSIYVNGEKKGEDTFSGTRQTMDKVTIGQSGNSDRYLNGLIDEVRIYNRALSPSEIQALYEATKP